MSVCVSVSKCKSRWSVRWTGSLMQLSNRVMPMGLDLYQKHGSKEQYRERMKRMD